MNLLWTPHNLASLGALRAQIHTASHREGSGGEKREGSGGEQRETSFIEATTATPPNPPLVHLGARPRESEGPRAISPLSLSVSLYLSHPHCLYFYPHRPLWTPQSALCNSYPCALNCPSRPDTHTRFPMEGAFIARARESLQWSLFRV